MRRQNGRRSRDNVPGPLRALRPGSFEELPSVGTWPLERMPCVHKQQSRCCLFVRMFLELSNFYRDSSWTRGSVRPTTVTSLHLPPALIAPGGQPGPALHSHLQLGCSCLSLVSPGIRIIRVVFTTQISISKTHDSTVMFRCRLPLLPFYVRIALGLWHQVISPRKRTKLLMEREVAACAKSTPYACSQAISYVYGAVKCAWQGKAR